MGMRERRIWLSQIDRIHAEQKRTRDREAAEQVESYINRRTQEEQQ
jgi:hypothetical protein